MNECIPEFFTYRTTCIVLLCIIFRLSLCNLIVRPEHVVARVGEEVVFKCSSNLPPIIWSHGSKENGYYGVVIFSGEHNITTGHYFVDMSESGDFNLVIRSAYYRDIGLYSCEDGNGVGERHGAELVVLDSDPVCGMNSTESTLFEGDVLQMRCEFNFAGNFVPLMFWSSDNEETKADVTIISRTNYSDRTSVVSYITVTAGCMMIIRPYTFKLRFNTTSVVYEKFSFTNISLANPYYNFQWRSDKISLFPCKSSVHSTPATSIFEQNLPVNNLWFIIIGAVLVVVVGVCIGLVVALVKSRHGTIAMRVQLRHQNSYRLEQRTENSQRHSETAVKTVVESRNVNSEDFGIYTEIKTNFEYDKLIFHARDTAYQNSNSESNQSAPETHRLSELKLSKKDLAVELVCESSASDESYQEHCDVSTDLKTPDYLELYQN